MNLFESLTKRFLHKYNVIEKNIVKFLDAKSLDGSAVYQIDSDVLTEGALLSVLANETQAYAPVTEGTYRIVIEDKTYDVITDGNGIILSFAEVTDSVDQPALSAEEKPKNEFNAESEFSKLKTEYSEQIQKLQGDLKALYDVVNELIKKPSAEPTAQNNKFGKADKPKETKKDTYSSTLDIQVGNILKGIEIIKKNK